MLIKRLNTQEAHWEDDELRRGAPVDTFSQFHLSAQQKMQAAVLAMHRTTEQLNTLFAHRDDVALLHDLRFASGPAHLHIDHLFITDNFHVFMIESRTAASKLVMNLESDFISTDECKAACAIPSPIKQLKRNRSILKREFQRMEAPTKFRRPLTPIFHQYVLVEPTTIISNRTAKHDEFFITIPQLMALIDAQTDKKSLLHLFNKMPAESLRSIARKIANLHLPKGIRFTKKFKHVYLPSFEHSTN